MSNKKKHLNELHQEIVTWKSTLSLAKDEIDTFRKELAEIASKNSKMEVVSMVESFQNRFIRQSEVNDELMHELGEAHQQITELSRNNPASDHVLVDDHIDLRDKHETNTKIFGDLKTEYRQFLSRHL